MLTCKKNDFRLDPSTTYLNCAYMSPLPSVVEEAGIRGIREKRNPADISPEQFFDDTDHLRTAFSTLINSKDPKRSVVIPSVSYGMANVAKNLPLEKGDNIIVMGEQFPSNVYPWRSLAAEKGAEIITITPPGSNLNRGKMWNERILEAITPKTKLVAIGHVHWADGTMFDLKAIRSRTKDTGAWLVIDGTQSVGALPFDVQQIEPDALVCTGYKWLLGPYSIGISYYGEVLDEGRPVEENWINRTESEQFSELVKYNEQYQPGALRYEVGEHSNFILVPMLLEAIKLLNFWGSENIQQYCRELISESIHSLRGLGFRIEDDAHRASHLFGIRLDKEHDMKRIQSELSKKKIKVSYRGDSIRVSPNVYNEKEELNLFTECLYSAVH
jgi:selenocysteine lyase/cysteine desulfurase